MNCLTLLKEKGYDLRGYSPDTILALAEKETDNEDECTAYLWFLESTYG